MFRLIENLISFLGYLLGVVLIIFSVYPLQKINTTTQDLQTIYPKYCDINNLKKYTQNDIFDNEKNIIKNDLNLNISIDQIKNIINKINSISTYTGKLGYLEIETCLTNENLDTVIAEAKNFFKNKKNLFYITDTNEYLIGVNQIPMLYITNIKIKEDSLIAISNLCHASIINKELYLFIWNDLKGTNLLNFKSEVILFKFKFEDIENLSLYQKSIQNIVNSMHYIKQIINSCKNE